MNNDTEHKKAKETKKCVIKQELMFKNYKDCQYNNEIKLKSQQRFKRDYRNVYTKQINKVALSRMMIRDGKHLIKLQYIHLEQTHSKYANVKC